MNRGRWTPLFITTVCVLIPLGVRGLQGCYSQVPNDGLVDAGRLMVDVVGGDSPGFVGPGVPCGTAPGAVPSPNCVITSPAGSASCVPTAACQIGMNSNGGSCGAPPLCYPLATNTAPNYDFRMEALHITSPPALASSLIQNSVVTGGVTLNASPQGSTVPETCGYGNVGGAGAFTWLISLNTMTKTVVTGGAPPVTDPYSQGYCFVQGSFPGVEGGAPIPVSPLEAGVTLDGSTFSTAPNLGVLNIPIFTAVVNPGPPIILPIRGAALSNVTVSPDGNCIGDINPDWLATQGPDCYDNSLATCPKWYTNGALTGYITLADANKIQLTIVTETLCVLLVGKSGIASCAPSDLTSGNYCSTTLSPGGCNDSFWLSATFAANAVKITPGSSPLCTGSLDGGGD